ncbi:MFS transporter [Oxalobacteraceae bacterium A2-2]
MISAKPPASADSLPAAPPWWRHAAYGLLGLPLAMAALPVYVQIPAYYSRVYGVGLAQLGWVLFGARLFDTVQDPLLGHAIDHARGSLARWLALAAVVLALAFAGLWLPPAAWALPWLAAMLVLAYSAHSLLNIAYLSWGARLQGAAGGTSAPLLPAAAWREGAGLLGVIAASVIPAAILGGAPAQATSGMAYYSLAFAALLLAGLLALLRAAPPWPERATASPDSAAPCAAVRDSRAVLRRMAANRPFRQLLAPYLLNAVSVSLPATLAMFFISDRLQAAAYAGAFLGSYFAAAACGLPLWTRLAGRIGVRACWRLGMALATLCFAGAALLGPGDIAAYFAICIAAGLALGADLAMPPVLLAQLIPADEEPGAYYGVLTLLGKLALALSGLALPLLAALGYRPGAATGSGQALVLAYAVLPCLCKLLAMAALRRGHPLPTRSSP